MASIFKRKQDRSRKGSKWTARYFNHEVGSWRSFVAYPDKDLSMVMAQRLELESGLRREGFTDTMRDRSILPIEQPLLEFLTTVRSRENGDGYLAQLEQRIRRVLEETGVKRLIDIDAGRVESALLLLRCQRGFEGDEGKLVSGTTRNEYATSIKAFTAWAFKRRWIGHDPLAALAKASMKKVGRERPRRALTAAQVGALLDGTRRRPEIELMTIRTGENKGQLGAKVRDKVLVRARKIGQDRWMAYLLAVWSGLRRQELQKLQWGDLHIDALVPHIQLRSETTKAKRADVIPLHFQLVNALKAHRSADAKATDRVLATVPSPRVLMKDLAFAGIEYGNREIGYADLHAQRKTLNLLLAAEGVSGRTRQAQLRHSDPRLTEGTYFDASVFLLPQSQEIAKVPAIPVTPAAVVGGSEDKGIKGHSKPKDASASPAVAQQVAPLMHHGAPLMHQTGGFGGQGLASDGNSHHGEAAHHAQEGDAEKACISGEKVIKWQDPASCDTGSFEKRAKGFEPSTFTLAT